MKCDVKVEHGALLYIPVCFCSLIIPTARLNCFFLYIFYFQFFLPTYFRPGDEASSLHTMTTVSLIKKNKNNNNKIKKKKKITGHKFLRVSNFCRPLVTLCSPENTETQHESSGRQQSEIVRDSPSR